MTSKTRRTVLRSMLAAGVGLSPWGKAFSQNQTPSTLLRAPKQALVIGNGRYKHAPLRNPVNDATSMAAVLKAAGFNVTLGLELAQRDLQEAIRAYIQGLLKTKAVGLFYFAGHAVQLAWRNYLIPVDVQIDSTQELRERAVDVNGLIEGIARARNPMNIVVLDACRDNPFDAIQFEQRGLSQLDAPPGTLLAYATAPGNTAADGEGENGLYTEHLLREMKVPEAKIEDVFKRVRLAVRRRSNGRQIPWESTSLEEDFWFIPPARLKKLAEEEQEREFKQELAVWERAQNSLEPEPIEDYLRNYPSGKFSELAHLKLDQVLGKRGENKVETVAAPDNPYTKGSARTDTNYRIGDSWIYRRSDLFTKLAEGPRIWTVTDITDKAVIFNEGNRVTDLLGNVLRPSSQVEWGPNQIVPLEFVVGKKWSTRFSIRDHLGLTTLSFELRIAERERVTVPAGTFDAFRVEGTGFRQLSNGSAIWNWNVWHAPAFVRRPVAVEMIVRGPSGRLRNTAREELVSFQQA